MWPVGVVVLDVVDHQAFESRLEALWFQRKTLLADGRDADAEQQSELIQDFCGEEGIRRLENVAGALISEAHRDLEEGLGLSALVRHAGHAGHARHAAGAVVQQRAAVQHAVLVARLALLLEEAHHRVHLVVVHEGAVHTVQHR